VTDTQQLLRFGTFELNLSTQELRKSGTLIKLSPQPLKLLAMLAQRSGQVVTREEIQQSLWGSDTYVDFEQGMNHCVKQIRNALSDSADTPLYVETVPRRGYRFLAPVVSKTIAAPPPRVVESQSGLKTRPSLPTPPAPIAQPATAAQDLAPVAATARSTPPEPTTVIEPKSTVPAMAEIPERKVTPPASRRLWTWVGVAAVVLIGFLALASYWRARKAAAVLTEKDNIVVAEFDNTTGEPLFDNALKQALIVQLEQSPFLNILSDQRVSEELRFMGMPGDVRLSADVARQVCQRTGSKAMMTGSISGLGGHYIIRLNSIDCATGDSLAGEQADADSRERVLRALGAASRRMREKLGESLASLQKYDTPIEQATTPSLEALKAYSLGIRMGNSQGYAAAVPYFKSAIDLDPNFAMAYARLGTEYYNLNQPTLAAQYTSKAYQLRDRTSMREKLYITSHYHDLVSGDADQTIAAYQLLQQAYPREPASYMNLNSWYNATGKYDEALAQAQQALQLDPDNVVNYNNLALTYVDLDRLDDAQHVLDQAQARKLADPALLADVYEVAFLRGDSAVMAHCVAAGAGKPGIEDQMFALQSDTEAYFGRLNKARAMTQSAHDSATRAGSPETAALWRLTGALHEAELGDASRARTEANAALAASPGKNVEILAALVLARSGDLARATSLAEQLVKQYPADTLVNDYWVASVRAAIALQQKNPAAAVEALQTAAPYETGSPSPGISFYPVYLRGVAYLQQGEASQAAGEFQKMQKHRGIVLNLSTAALAKLQLARAQAMAAEGAAAGKSYEEFLALWKDADPDLPVLKQAKAEYAKLQ
jgi:DNA-binding winged helix-turn-helix (wHTH) protein/tetratricopeptide (TPR) repeat protein